MMFKYLMILAFPMLCNTLVAQNKVDTTKREKKFDFGLEGMFGVSFGQNFYSFNVGGPSLHLRIDKNWKLGFGALPSLYVYNGKLGAKLGVAPRLDYENLVLFAPFFYREAADKWIWSVGVGYKFQKKK